MKLQKEEKKIYLSEEIQKILHKLQNFGKGYVVGGYIRDCLLGLTPKDCDFVTDIPYEKLLEIFSENQPKEIGKSFGIVQIKFREKIYEIAKMRTDIGIPENRKVQDIAFTHNIYEDLMRRDFSVNSIAYDGKYLYYLDSALSDLTEKKILLFNGIPEIRMKEDPLRILRGIRFSITKNLFLSNLNIYRENIDLLSNISIERVRDEFTLILLSDSPLKGIELLVDSDAMKYIIPEIDSLEIFDIRRMKNSSCNLPERLSILLENLNHEEILFKLKFPKKIIREVECIKNPFRKENLDISGYELSEMGYSGGEIGAILRDILTVVKEGKIRNCKNEILQYIKQSN